jgi:hypothetical protein
MQDNAKEKKRGLNVQNTDMSSRAYNAGVLTNRV